MLGSAWTGVEWHGRDRQRKAGRGLEQGLFRLGSALIGKSGYGMELGRARAGAVRCGRARRGTEHGLAWKGGVG